MEEITKKAHIRATAQETDLIYNRLSKAAPGDLITYDELSQIINRKIKECRYYLSSARRRALNDDGKVFAVVTGKGIKCCNDTDTVGEAMGKWSTAKRATRKAVRIATTVRDFDNLSQDTKAQHQHMLIGCRTLELFSKKSMVKRIAETMQPTPLGPTSGALIEFFKKQDG